MIYQITLRKGFDTNIEACISIKEYKINENKICTVFKPAIFIIVDGCKATNIDYLNNTKHKITNDLIIDMIKTGRYLNCKEIFTILLKEDIGNFILENGVWYDYIRVSYK